MAGFADWKPLPEKEPGETDVRKLATDTDVMQIATEYADRDSPIMRQAESRGREFANRRGLLNSTLAGQAERAATLDYVLPMASQTSQQRYQMASQTAQQNFQSEEQRRNFDREMTFEGFRQHFNREQAAMDRTLQRDLQSQRLSFEEAQNQYERDLRERLQKGQLTFQAEQALKDRLHRIDLAKMDIDFQDRISQRETDLRRELAGMNLSEADRRTASTLLSNAFNDFEDAQRSILSNPELPAVERNKLLEASKAMLEQKINFTKGLYSGSYDIWPENPFKASTTTTTSQQTSQQPIPYQPYQPQPYGQPSPVTYPPGYPTPYRDWASDWWADQYYGR